MTKTFTSRTLLLAGCAGIATFAAPAHAQDAAAEAASASEAEDGQIIVTARRREERLIDVPLSITALSGESLAQQGIQDLTQIAQQVPNLTLEVSRGTNTTLTAFNLFGGTGAPIAVTSNFNGSATFKDFNPRASISWQPNADHNLYFTYSQGFKGGGFDPRGQTTACRNPRGGACTADEVFDFMAFDPETVDSFELGWKASLLDNRVNIRLAGFIAQYTDVQIPGSVGFDANGDGTNETFIGITSNAGEADVNGIEFEGNALVGKDFAGDGSRFSINWSLGVLDAKYNTFIDAFGNDVADQRVFQNTPEITAHMGFNFGLPMAGGMTDFIGLASLRSDASQFEVPNPFLDQDGFVLVDASVVYTVDSGLFSIGVHGKNLFDKEYIVAGYNFVAGGVNGAPFIPTLGREGTLTGFYGDPRRVFVTAQVNF
jgi:iron complex outermembrane receptor protein